MRKNLKQESYQLFHRWGAWILLCMAFLGCFLIAKSTPIGAERWHARVDAKCITLMTKAEAEWHVEWYTTISHNRVDKELVGLGDRYGLPPGSVKNGAEIYAALSEAEYTRLMWFEGGLLCFCIIFPAILISYPLDRGIPEWSVSSISSAGKPESFCSSSFIKPSLFITVFLPSNKVIYGNDLIPICFELFYTAYSRRGYVVVLPQPAFMFHAPDSQQSLCFKPL